jgi:hypothetical protein
MRELFFIVWLFGLSPLGFTQQQLQNGDFESWENGGTAEHEPINWSSLKTADALAGQAPAVLSQDVGRNGGFCAKLEVKTAFFIAANGIMTNGRVHADFTPSNGYVYTDPNDSQWNTSFTSRPDSIVGWYKYEPQNGDEGKIEVVLHVGQGKLPFNGTESNVIGRAKFRFMNQTNTWTRFSKAFNYSSQQTPAYLLATIASGDSTISETGSTLWVDDISLVYNTSNLEEHKSEITSVNASEGYLHFNSSESLSKQKYIVQSLAGRVIQSGVCEKNVSFSRPTGIYLIHIMNGESYFTKKVYVH